VDGWIDGCVGGLLGWVCVWMHGWMDGCTKDWNGGSPDSWMDGHVGGWLDRWMEVDGCMHAWVNGWGGWVVLMDGLMNGRTDIGRIDGCLGGRLRGLVDGW
jgi:hypothetical protein